MVNDMSTLTYAAESCNLTWPRLGLISINGLKFLSRYIRTLLISQVNEQIHDYVKEHPTKLNIEVILARNEKFIGLNRSKIYTY